MNVLVLQVIFKRDLDYCKDELIAISRAVANKFKRAMHTSRNMAYVITTPESEQELMNRLAFVLDKGCIEDCWCYQAPRVVVSTRKGFDSLETYIKAAHSEIGKPRETHHIEQRQRFPRREVNVSEDIVRDAPIKVFTKTQPKRRKSEHSNEQDRD